VRHHHRERTCRFGWCATPLDPNNECARLINALRDSPAVPSTTDTTVAGYPDALYILVSLAPSQVAPDGEPGIRAWWIVDRSATEVRLRLQR